jgi:hypothetical protein
MGVRKKGKSRWHDVQYSAILHDIDSCEYFVQPMKSSVKTNNQCRRSLTVSCCNNNSDNSP